MPAGQLEQADAEPAEYVPGSQLVQTEAPPVEYVPGGHGRGQEEAELGPAAKQPASIGEHDPDGESLYSPGGHGMQAVDPGALNQQ